MKALVDTHCWLWWLSDSQRLNAQAREWLADQRNSFVISVASSWEIAIKVGLGKLELPEPPESYVPSRLRSQGMSALAIQNVHALRVASLPRHHRDPFDRLLVAQAQLEGLPIMTADSQIAAYGVEILWAGRGSPP